MFVQTHDTGLAHAAYSSPTIVAFEKPGLATPER